MRRLARLCFSATLCAVSGPALAANDGFMILGLQETQAPASAPADVPLGPCARARARGTQRRPYRAAAERRRVRAGSRLARDRVRAGRRARAAIPATGSRLSVAGGAGTIVVDTPDRFLFLVEPHGKALRYGIGVGRPGFEWAGVKRISRKAEWPDWTPPQQMLLRRPDLPRHMAGGPDNPLGARALYLGSSLYRIHGTNEPSTIGHNVSSGCIRMMNEDVIDLYNRVPVGAKVVVL